MTTIFTVGFGARLLGIGKRRGLRLAQFAYHRPIFLVGVAILSAWPVLTFEALGQAIPPDTCRDTVFFLPCDYLARQSLGKAETLSNIPADTMAVPPTALAPMSGMSGIWDGARVEVITSDSTWVGVPYSPGSRHGLAMGSRSRLYVVYDRGPGGRLYFVFRNPGGSWSPEIAFPASPAGYARGGVAIAPGSDSPQFFYLERLGSNPARLVHAIYDFNNAEWTADTITRSDQTTWNPAARIDIGVDALGGFHVVWDEPGWNEALNAWVDQVAYAENTRGGWHTQIVSRIGTAPLIELDTAGRALIAYHVRRDGHDYKIFAANRYRADTMWTADSIDTAPATYYVADMRLDREGTLHVLFAGPDCYQCTFIHRLFYTKRVTGSTTFDPWYQLFDHAEATALMVDCSARAHVWFHWYDEESLAPWMYYATNSSGGWTTQRFHVGGISDYAVAPGQALILDRFDQTRAVFTQSVDYRNLKLLYYGSPTVYLDVIDVMRLLGHVYQARPVCDETTYDANCDGALDAADLVWLIDYTFRNGPKGCRF
jgi:hypothetical protein